MTSAIILIFALVFCSHLAFGVVLSGSEGPTEVKKKSFMQTSFTVDDSGVLRAQTRTWSKDKWRGFTGGAFIVLMDDAKNVLWNSEQHRYGVNGKKVPGRSDRTETWSEQVPTSALPNVRAYVIKHQHTPTNRVGKWILDHKSEILTGVKLISSMG